MREQAAPVSHQLTGYLLVPWFQLHKMCNPFGIPPVMRHKELLGDLPVEVHLHTSQLQHHVSLLLLPPTVHSAYQKQQKTRDNSCIFSYLTSNRVLGFRMLMNYWHQSSL
jgi:hypothetical protein